MSNSKYTKARKAAISTIFDWICLGHIWGMM